jgi:RNA polymerase sigma-70 factor (ECF subfamily)
VWQTAPRFVPDGRPNSLLRYAIRIARNRAVSELRRIRATPIDDDDLEHALAAAAEQPIGAPDPILRRTIAICHDRLSPKQRLVFDARLAGAGGQDDEVLAASVGMQRNAFLQNFSRARRSLAKCLKLRGVSVKLGSRP